MIALGKTVTQIAGELYLSVVTVSAHRAHILEKMNTSTTAELIHDAVGNHLVD
jgi:DNA-binding NarL/FixJ family response regulator